MRKIILGVVLLISQSLFAQEDTTQQITPGRKNALEQKNKPYVILISADGFRNDYAEKHNAKHLKSLAEKGISAKGMIPSFPSNTFPNHYSIVTGMYPSNHGLIDNSFYDPKRKQMYNMWDKEAVRDNSWYGGLPLWGLAEKNGLMSASLFWVTSESNVAGTSPSYFYKYHEKFNNDQKIAIVTEWLQLPEDVRPHFITLYFPEVDSNGHHHGPDSPENIQAIAQVDAAVGKLVAEVEKLGLPDVNFVFVSDHGMLLTDYQHPIGIPKIIDKEKFVVVNAFSLVRITAHNKKDVPALYKQLKKEKTKDYEVYLASKFPKRLHFNYNADDRIGDIFLVPKAPKVFNEDPNQARKYPGAHGYDPKKVKEMHASFYAWGDQFKSGKKIKGFNNVNVYPLIAEILDLPIEHKIDGKLKVLKKTLK